ncbi:hypothetical protein CEP52_016803 [Fusarium oligoseptatum]|uniref:Uncharacterized protein n=1 Tax=Fusarium oligoseptatum TaxID=2604345 RepID=A0A428RZX5_9HYPO|nr:hypothetical protein CEP52_016803 [Fusarium oligoseptatum]
MPSRSILRAANLISPREAPTGSLPSMACFTLAFLAYYVPSFRPRHSENIFHYLSTIALLVGAISYFAMASGLAYSVIPTHLYTRDAATGVSWATIFFNILLTWIWIISYLCSSYTTTRYKWGFYTFGTIAYLLLAF